MKKSTMVKMYMVFGPPPYTGEYKAMTMDDKGILYIARTFAAKNTGLPEIFPSKRDARNAIERTKRYAKRQGYAKEGGRVGWKLQYSIVPVKIPIR